MQLTCRLLAIGFALLVGASTAHAQVYTGTLTGAKEAPPNSSTATGSAAVIVNPVAHTLRVVASFSGITSNTTAAHIHCCTTTPFTGTAIVATKVPAFTGFPIGAPSGAWDSTDDTTQTSSWNGPFITANGGTNASAEAALFAGIAAGRAYLNIHSNTFPGGEIRDFLVLGPSPIAPSAIPTLSEWAQLAMVGLLVLGGLWALRRRAT